MAEAGGRSVLGYGLPAILPDAAGTEHGVVLDPLLCRSVGGIEAVAHRHAGQRHLIDTIERPGKFETAAIQNRGNDVGGVVVLVAYLASGLHAPRPGDDQRITGATRVGVALEHLEWRRERHGPAGRVMLVGVGAAQLVDELHVF